MARPTGAERAGDWLAWAGAGAAAMLGACIPLAGAGYVFDLGANLAAQGLLVVVAIAAWLAARRRWGRCAVAVCAGAALAWPLAVRPWTGPALAGMPARPVRVLVFNSSANVGDAVAAMELIRAMDADVVVLTEPSRALLGAIRDSPWVAGRYPGFFLPARAGGGYMVVLSVWGQAPILGERPADIAQGPMRVLRVERPEGPFVLMALHPDSPRTPWEWAQGNQLVRSAAGMLGRELMVLGLPVVVAADLNSTPTGWRSRRLGEAGVRRAKPLFAGGTYPAAWPRPMRVAIDDVWVSPESGVVSWRALPGGGSDHLAVLVELAIPGRAAPAGP